MARIIAGSVGGRTIAVPPRGTRPTTDRVREALFTALDHDGLLDGARVLDLYAGSGALGLEAASRGAARVDLVESDRRAADVCRANARSLGLTGLVRTHQAKVETFLAASTGSTAGSSRAAGAVPDGGWTLAFLDPPYDVDSSRVAAVLAALVPHLAADAVVVLERSVRSEPVALPEGLEAWRDRRYGETVLHLLDHVASTATAGPDGDPADGSADDAREVLP
ncbi:MAG TPA: 16S rRNA (guanine(966)-N(2))-methyltransferase RsmD [Micrococcales bacterium]|uniref:16S rRNA (guanine(966)-N(2))-methyltransferase RsmD n=1 Tax=Miniimonas arenae TaxID=676201 RepID=UPI000EC41D93|nr:16S rRNA (guanine(966)-N(2))-methyltransferase RsmD [Miniimonas arenae]HCX84407.1 16S rRNA (guanine(966)-N(2))-methyltransferase RsmD [Micrococcales bacterium]